MSTENAEKKSPVERAKALGHKLVDAFTRVRAPLEAAGTDEQKGTP